MRIFTSTLTATVALTSLLAAQAGPGQITASAVSKTLTYGTGGQIPGAWVQQISHNRLPGDAAGTWTTCVTTTSLPTTNGGKGNLDLLMGSFNAVTGKFTPNLYAAALNTTGVDFGLMLDPTGLFAVYDQASGVYFSSRKSLTAAFSAPVKVSGITGTYVDPALGRVGGKLKIFYAVSNTIVMQDLDITSLTAPKVSGQATTVVTPIFSGTPNSPTPITGPDGDVEGLWYAELVGSDNDMMWAGDLDSKTPGIRVVDTTTWINNGGVMGGRLTHAGPSAAGVYELGVAWLLGDVTAIGGKADIFGAFAKTANGVGITAIFLAAKEAKALSFPGFKGSFALDLTSFSPLGAMTHVDNSDRGALQIVIPNDNSLKGIVVALQGLSIDTKAQTYTFTNTTFLKLQ